MIGKANKKPICFLQYDLRGGGAERKVCTLANYFASQGHLVEVGLFGKNNVAYELDKRVRVTYICRDTYQYKNDIEKLRYRLAVIMQKCFVLFPAVVINGACNILRIKPFKRMTPEAIRAHYQKRNNHTLPIRSYILHRPDSVFITMMVSSYLAVMRVIEKYRKKDAVRNKYIVMDCNDPTKNATPETDKLRNKYYPMADYCAVMTQGAKEYFNRDIQEKCVVIPNPVRDDLPLPYHGERRHVIVNCCRLHPQKNLPLLIEAFSMLIKDYPDYRLEIYGEGQLEMELNAYIASLGIQEYAHICRFDPNIHDKIKDCMMFVSSSDWEGFSNSVMEALAIGMPTIATDCNFGPREMIEDHKNGLLTPPGDVHALYEAMKAIAGNPSLAQELSRNAVLTREKYAAQKIGDIWLEIINENGMVTIEQNGKAYA